MATSEQILPNDDRDLILAQQLGDVLESGSALSAVEDPLIAQLLGFKEAVEQDVHSYTWSAELWENIIESTQKTLPARVLPFYRTSGFARFAAAATILIAAFTGLFLYTQSRPVVVGESLAEMQQIILDDGSEITLRPYSTLLALKVDEQNRSYRIRGEGFFNVEHDPERPFRVEAGEASVTVLGTRFNLQSWGSSSVVYLEEGSVRFDDRNNQNVILVPGEAASLSQGLIRKQEASPRVYTDWISNTLVLDNTSVRQALNELEQHYNISIESNTIENPEELLGGTVLLDETETTLSDLGVILGGTFRKTGERNYRFVPLN